MHPCFLIPDLIPLLFRGHGEGPSAGRESFQRCVQIEDGDLQVDPPAQRRGQRCDLPGAAEADLVEHQMRGAQGEVGEAFCGPGIEH